MSKVKDPCLSLDARGSIGEVMSYAKRRGVNIAEKKPIPKDQRTLLQMYSRWLYEDYAYLWKKQTPATQAEYRSLGAKCHLTGYQYWMSYQLTYLPDIVGWWTLDSISGGIVSDRSRHGNDGTVFNALIAPGLIDNGLYFDGSGDRVRVLNNPTLQFGTGDFSGEFFFRLVGGQRSNIVAKRGPPWTSLGWSIDYKHKVPGALDMIIGTGSKYRWVGVPFFDELWHYCYFERTGNTMTLFVDEASDTLTHAWIGANLIETNNLWLGWGDQSFYHKGDLDNIVLRTRLLDATERERHRLRRYPL